MSVDGALREIGKGVAEGAIIRDRDVLEAYAKDESEAEPVVPDAVIRPGTTEEVAVVLRAACAHGVPVTPRGGGTGRVGGAVPAHGGFVLTTERLNTLRGIEKDNLITVVEPGVVLGQLHRGVEEEGLFFPPDPNSADSSVLGGNINTNAAGPRALKYGPMRNWLLGMRVVTGDGTVLSLGKRTQKGVTGYDLASLVVGSEGTLAVVTEATLKLMPLPEAVVTMLVYLPDHPAVEAAVRAAFEHGFVPRCMEFLDELALDILRPQAGIPIPEQARAMMIVELDGDENTLGRQLEVAGEAMLGAGAVEVLVAKSTAERERLWGARREMSYSMRKQARNKLAEDVVVPRNQICRLLDECARIQDELGIRVPSYGHAGDGNLHVNFLWNDPKERPLVEQGIERLFRTVIAAGGTLTGEHGLGLLKMPYLHLEQGPELIALQADLKRRFDPRGVLNPGKCFPVSHGAC